jgi:chromosome segregation protein
MLKALELVGFKSFADKTRFEFPPGITVVVGPNGSGKSNVVDAVKWVLGEQSVKSLRGKEMADVIFAGSGSRPGLNSAETTLTFDNSQRLLAIDAPEVHVTRRVYRSGEGEYLINRQACRLRDIRDLIAGTGVGGEAYSIIEQGKVDVLLAASSRDRRVIFEEAAGISRFKAKKVESLRRLERVDQNLLRLADIVEEVEGRLKSVRNQAAKARRYRDYAERLQALRTQAGLADWRRLSEELAGHERKHEELARAAVGLAAESAALEARLAAADAALEEIDEALHAAEEEAAANRERVAGCESTLEHQRTRLVDLEDEAARCRRQLAALGLKAGDLDRQVREIAAVVQSADAQHSELVTRLTTGERAAAELAAKIRAMKQEQEECRATGLEQMRAASALASETSALESRAAGAEGLRSKLAQQVEALDAAQAGAAEELAAAQGEEADLAAAAEVAQNDLALVQRRLAQRRRDEAARAAELGQMRERHTGLRERAGLLEELEQRLEGHTQGVKEVMRQARGPNPGPYRQVLGLVAELLHVRIESAPLVEVALGEATGFVVLGQGSELVEHLQQAPHPLQGRVGFIRLDAALEDAPARPVLDGLPGVVGRADRLVETTPPFAQLRERLLGRTWVVETLGAALALAEGAGRGEDFVTLAGERVARDGTLTIGPRQTVSGLISRRSELRFLREQIVEQEARIRDSEGARALATRQVAEEEDHVFRLAGGRQEALAALAAGRQRTAGSAFRLAQIEDQRRGLAADEGAAAAQREEAERGLARAAAARAVLEAEAARLEVRASQVNGTLEQAEAVRMQQLTECTAAQVESAKSEERLEGLRSRLAQHEREQFERRRSVAECRAQLGQADERGRRLEREVLGAESTVAELYLEKEALAAKVTGLARRREADRADRAGLAAEGHRVREAAADNAARLHQVELAAGQTRLERNGLATRLRDDYGIDLATQDLAPSEEELRERAEVDQEIAELRRKINAMGNVNLDALVELEELEARFGGLSSQHQDLAKAKAALEQIIGRINADSRRLFAETLEEVRGHFQSLFRKLFGGGQADILLEEGVDILDSGVEIVARPPGKELRSISLLSGGEKTLTCVALLLAIFRSRPSPFCILDEVDAALDEANIQRFIGVLKEFLAWTQFIVVTHSKKTMTCATTLYGVTMQESGVSKRVSVRFEDVSENGEIRAGAGDVGADAEPILQPGPASGAADGTQAA